MTANHREYDLVLFGATGFTGKLVAEYLATRRSIRWALAGRSREKLEACARIRRINPAARDLPILLGDSLDGAAINALTRSARVVCTTVGPY